MYSGHDFRGSGGGLRWIANFHKVKSRFQLSMRNAASENIEQSLSIGEMEGIRNPFLLLFLVARKGVVCPFCAFECMLIDEYLCGPLCEMSRMSQNLNSSFRHVKILSNFRFFVFYLHVFWRFDGFSYIPNFFC